MQLEGTQSQEDSLDPESATLPAPPLAAWGAPDLADDLGLASAVARLRAAAHPFCELRAPEQHRPLRSLRRGVGALTLVRHVHRVVCQREPTEPSTHPRKGYCGQDARGGVGLGNHCTHYHDSQRDTGRPGRLLQMELLHLYLLYY